MENEERIQEQARVIALEGDDDVNGESVESVAAKLASVLFCGSAKHASATRGERLWKAFSVTPAPTAPKQNKRRKGPSPSPKAASAPEASKRQLRSDYHTEEGLEHRFLSSGRTTSCVYFVPPDGLAVERGPLPRNVGACARARRKHSNRTQHQRVTLAFD